MRKRNARIPAAKVNWDDDVSAVYEFKTDIFTAFDGTERREAGRAEPRISLSYSTLLHSELKQRHLNDVAWAQDGQFFVPIPWRKATVASGSGTTLTMSEVPFWIVPGVQLIITGTDSDELVTVSSISGMALTLSAALVYAVAAGDTVRPVITCRMTSNFAPEAVTDGVMQGDESYNVDPGSDILTFANFTPAQSGGVDIAPWVPNWAGGLDVKFNSLRRTFDPMYGSIYSDNPRDFNPRIFGASFLFDNKVEVEQFLSFFNRQRGRRGQFYIDLGMTEWNVSAVAASGTTKLIFAGDDLATTFGSSMIYHSLSVTGAWGSQVNQIQSVALTAGGDSEVTFAQPWGGDITPTDRLSWWHAWRFATDKLQISWITDEVAKIDTSFQAIPKE